LRKVSKRLFTLSASLLLALCAVARGVQGQGAAAAEDAETQAVRKVVETYLFTEEADEKKETLLEDARIVFVGPGGKETRVEAVSARKGKTGGKVERATQKVVSIDFLNDAASVKVETVLRPDEPYFMKHTQYLWLLKTEAGWRIAGILMPRVAPVARPGDR
jgi:hypothetical protein